MHLYSNSHAGCSEECTFTQILTPAAVRSAPLLNFSRRLQCGVHLYPSSHAGNKQSPPATADPASARNSLPPPLVRHALEKTASALNEQRTPAPPGDAPAAYVNRCPAFQPLARNHHPSLSVLQEGRATLSSRSETTRQPHQQLTPPAPGFGRSEIAKMQLYRKNVSGEF